MMKHGTQIIGHVGSEPTMRYTPSGQAVTNFTVAANEQYTNSAGERVKKTIWFRVQTWGKKAETMKQYVKKGMLVYVEGKLVADDSGNPRVWTGSDGTAHANFEINAFHVQFLSRVDDDAEQEHDRREVPPEDDMPF